MSNHDSLLLIRLQGAGEAQKRSRLAFLAATIVSLAFIIACWNAYLSWYRGFAEMRCWPAGQQITEELQKHLVQHWVESQMIGVPFLGVMIGVSDLAVLGSLSLFIITIWFYYSMRRENHTIGQLLRDTLDQARETREMVLHGVAAYLVFTSISKSDRPIKSLQESPSQDQPEFFIHAVSRVLIFSPTIAIAFIIVMDLLSLVYFPALFREMQAVNGQLKHVPILQTSKHLGAGFWSNLAIFEGCALVLCLLTTIVCTKILQYEKATGQVLREYALRLNSPAAQDGNSTQE